MSPRRGRYIMPRNMDKSSRYRWRGFLRMLRSAEEYGAVKDYAEKVYCSELTTFIDEYQYIKLCLVQLLADTHDEDTRQVNAGLGNDIPTTTATDEHPSSRQQSFLERLQQSKISLARLPGILKSKLAPTTVLSHQPSPPMDNTSKASLLSKHLAVPPAKVSISPANVKLLETLKQQYPKLHLTADAPIPDTIQMLMLEFVRGYIDPSSELAVNLDSKTANEALEVIRSGERLGWDLLETAKDQVLELIYYNVYIPYCIEIDNRQFEDFFGIKPFYVK
ncbi:hypothetical protein EV182_006242 [Spiromyces aspiralis]|uniref:Uncharacterized protein n=1 Tax=Spiromyces aspiralis TaxID=68401 RepID=A0ACC1H8Z9_9FUNG|nr:hypothetical protein EV182_006242 [Spiromyces aspiralis]